MKNKYKNWYNLSKYDFNVILRNNAQLDLGILGYNFNHQVFGTLCYQYSCANDLPFVEIFIYNGNIITEIPATMSYKSDGGLYVQLNTNNKITISRRTRFNFELTYE